jgi:hypothetical protein
MTTAKSRAKEPKAKTPGTIMAEKLRAESNGLSHAEREELLREGLAMIYGGNINAKTKPHSRGHERSF